MDFCPMKPKCCLPLLLLLSIPFSQRAETPRKSGIADALKAELARTMDHLKKQPTPPYFMSYELTETAQTSVSGSFGALVSSIPINVSRQLGIDLRVGDYKLDNTHPIRGAMGNL